jgi:hypothetical protein
MNQGTPKFRMAFGIASLLFGIALICLPLWSLLGPSADDYTEPFADARYGYVARPFPFESIPKQTETSVRRFVTQFSSSIKAWGQAKNGQRMPSAVSFRLGLSRPTLAIDEATFTLAIGDPTGKCQVFRTGRSTLTDNSPLHLFASEMVDCPPEVSARLVLQPTSEEGTVLPADYVPSIWALGSSSQSTAVFSYLSIPSVTGRPEGFWSPQGGFVFPRSDLPGNRAELAAFVWGVSVPTATSWIALWMVLGALGIGISCFSLFDLLVNKAPRSRYIVTGLLLLISSAAMLQATLTPPLHGPDEPDHILTLLDVLHQPGQRQQLLDVARKIHFERIKFNAMRPFSAGMTVQPYMADWASHIQPTTTTRSALHSALWPKFLPLFSFDDINLSLLLLRIVHAVLFFATVAVSVWVLGGSSSAWPYLLVVTLAPALPFFGTMFSNYPFLVYSSLLIGACLYGEAIQTPHGFRRSLALGGAAVLSLLSAQTGIAAALIGLVVLLVHPLVTNTREDRSQSIDTLFLSCFALASFVVGWLLWSPAFWSERKLDIVLRLQNLTPSAALNAAELGQWAGSPFLVLITAIAATAIVWVVIDFLKRVCLWRFENWRQSFGPRRVQFSFVILAMVCLVMLILIFKAGVPLQNIEGIDGAKYTPVGYLKSVFITMSRSLAAGRPDFYLTWTYWGGFGWLDALLAESSVALVKNTMSLSIVIGIWIGFSRQNLLSKVWLVSIFISLGLALAILGLGAYSNGINLHGRYLIPFYVPLAGLAATGLQFSKHHSLLKFWPMWCLVVAGCVQSQVWNLLLTRYYLP